MISPTAPRSVCVGAIQATVAKTARLWSTVPAIAPCQPRVSATKTAPVLVSSLGSMNLLTVSGPACNINGSLANQNTANKLMTDSRLNVQMFGYLFYPQLVAEVGKDYFSEFEPINNCPSSCNSRYACIKVEDSVKTASVFASKDT